ncbi:hypothetical protein [Streptomyces sp. NBC_00503]|uniref:hypothetical protein n=1 Tax=Streptomyces sp. NBC_00503 TaxID=2903659 RepID=UPI002E804AF5|nr:hypothetical protein [Streptomyces sp. NBC_00503]WUD86355.1 hypothetical protein OG490_37705 [Streptomyces sp. NBC_00503]
MTAVEAVRASWLGGRCHVGTPRAAACSAAVPGLRNRGRLWECFLGGEPGCGGDTAARRAVGQEVFGQGEHTSSRSGVREIVSPERFPRVDVATDESMTHLDILFAAPKSNTFLTSATTFLGTLPR